MNLLTQVIINLVASIAAGGTVSVIVTALANRSKVSAEAEQIQANTDGIVVSQAMNLLKGVTEEVDRLRADMQESEDSVRRLRRAVVAYRMRVDYLTLLIQEKNIPVDSWNPPDGI